GESSDSVEEGEGNAFRRRRKLNRKIKFGKGKKDVKTKHIISNGVIFDDSRRYEVVDFIFEFEEFMDEYDATEKKWIRLFRAAIQTTDAKFWRDNTKPIKSYKELRKSFYEHFWNGEQHTEARKTFLRLRINHSSSKKICAELRKWLHILAETDVPDHMLIETVYERIPKDLKVKFNSRARRDYHLFDKKLGELTKTEEYNDCPYEITPNTSSHSETPKKNHG
ncbi:unnamed protein product, partial [Allacma fusca]